MSQKSESNDAGVTSEPIEAPLQPSPPPPRFLSKKETCARVGLSYPTIWLWMNEGRFPRSRELGGRVAWVEREIDDFILNRPVRRLKSDPQ